MTTEPDPVRTALLTELNAMRAAWSESPGDRDVLFDLLALYGGLRRLKPDNESKKACDELESLLREAGPDRIAEGLLALDPGAWLDAAADLQQALDRHAKGDPFGSEYDVEGESLAYAAGELLGQLDDAQLARYAAEAVAEAEAPQAWAEAVAACVEYARTQPELFMDAGDWACKMGESFRLPGELAAEPGLDRAAGLLELVASAADFWREDHGFEPALEPPGEETWRKVRVGQAAREVAATAAKQSPPGQWLPEIEREARDVIAAVISVFWPPAPVPVLDLHFGDAGKAPARQRLQVRRLNAGFDVPGIGFLRVSRQLTEQWRVVVDITTPEGADPVVSVQIHTLHATQAKPGDPAKWQVDLAPLTRKEKLTALGAPTIIAFRNGRQLRIQEP